MEDGDVPAQYEKSELEKQEEKVGALKAKLNQKRGEGFHNRLLEAAQKHKSRKKKQFKAKRRGATPLARPRRT